MARTGRVTGGRETRCGKAGLTYRRSLLWSRSQWLLLLLCLSAPLAARDAGDTSLTVPVDHWAYDLVERLEARGLLTGSGDGIKPFRRRQLARLALHADSLATAGQAMTPIDRQRVELLLAELAPEVTRLRGEPPAAATGLRTAVPGRRRPSVTYSGERGTMHADLLLRQQSDAVSGRGRDGTETVFRNRVGGLVAGQVGDGLGFRVAFQQTREQGSRGYVLREDVFEPRREAVQLKGDLADYHEGAAYVTFALGGYVDVQVGKDQVVWGPARADNLGLSANAPAFDMVRLRSRFGALKLVSLHGSLRPCPDRPDAPVCAGEADTSASYIVNGMTRSLDPKKWIAAHRLEAAVTPWLDIGFQEVVIYGDRDPEPSYLNPFMFYWAAQSYLGDKDNVMMAVDADLRLRPGVRLWAAYAIDDLKKLKIFSDDFANKFSLQTGLLWTDPGGFADLDVHADYVRIEPWIYTHKFPINTFRHFDAPLGHSLGPNSDRWRVRAQRRWRRDVATSLWVHRTRHGDNVRLADGSILNVGGDLHYGWRPGDERDDKDFLDGRLSHRTELGLAVDWRLLPRLRLRTVASWEWGDDVPLPPRDGVATPLQSRTGYGDGRQRQLSLDLRYGYL